MPPVASTLLNEERRRVILDLLARDGRLLVNDLAAHFGVSLVTVRNDLIQLQKRGLLLRVHGGAITSMPGPRAWPAAERVQHHVVSPSSISQPTAEASAAVIAIAQTAVGLVQPGDTVVLDTGGVSCAIAYLLRGRTPLTVITSSLHVARELADGGAEVLLTGGTLHGQGELTGHLTEEALAQLNADLAFVEAESIDAAHGLTARQQGEARLKRLMIHMARQAVVVAESGQFGRCSLYPIAPLKLIHHVVTDAGLAPAERETIAASGVRLAIAGESPGR